MWEVMKNAFSLNTYLEKYLFNAAHSYLEMMDYKSHRRQGHGNQSGEESRGGKRSGVGKTLPLLVLPAASVFIFCACIISFRK